jgi:hypothetical protein
VVVGSRSSKRGRDIQDNDNQEHDIQKNEGLWFNTTSASTNRTVLIYVVRLNVILVNVTAPPGEGYDVIQNRILLSVTGFASNPESMFYIPRIKGECEELVRML